MSNKAHIVWPAAIISLLLLSGLTVVAVIWASRSDGGAQVIDEYYERSVAWDSIAASRAAAADLGWTSHVEIRPSDAGAVALLSVVDSTSNPVAGLVGSVSVTRPQRSSLYGTFRLEEAEDTPGVYEFDFPFRGRGLWDIGISASKAESTYETSIRIEI